MPALRDQSVLLSGATSGLGRALALQLASEGCRLAVCGRSPDKLAALVDELGLPADRLLARAFDLADHAAAASFAEEALTHLGQINILVNNAGANLGKAPIGEVDLATFSAMLNLNCTAQLALTQPVWRAMSRTGGGRVVNILSSAAKFSVAGIAGYTASKTAFEGLTGVMRREGKPLGIHVTAVYPGGIDTPFRNQSRPDYLRPETVAEAIVGLLRLPSDAAAHELVLRPPVEDNLA